VERPDGTTVTTIVDENGHWEISPNPLPDGSTGTITETDPNGNSTGGVTTGPSDQTPPDESQLTVDQNNGDGLGGTGTPGDTITVERPDGTTVTTIVDENGHWEISPNPLPDGSTGTITETDPNGNSTGGITTGPSDQTPPDESQLTVDQNNGNGLGGTGTPGDTITVERPDGTTVTTIVDENGHWEISPNPLPDGSTGTITETDPNGNSTGGITTGPSDQTPPDESQLTVDQNNGSGLGGTGTPGDTITVERPDGTTVTTIVDENGHWEISPNPLPDGSTGTITETDPNGNSTGGITTGPSDQTPPDESQLTVDQNNSNGLGGTGTPGDTITVELPDGSTITTTVDNSGHWAISPNPLPDGATGTVVETDPAGNATGGLTTGPSDQTPPAALNESAIDLNDDVGTITGTIAHGGVTDDGKPTFSGHIDGGDVATVNVYDNGALIGSAAVDTDGNWSFEPALPITPGSHDFQAAPVDAAGNEGPKTGDWNFTLLGAAPAAPAITLVTDDNAQTAVALQKGDTTADATPTIGGTGSAGTTVTVFVNGTAVGSTVVADDGTWSLTTPTLSGDGVKTITAQASDAAGQLSPMTGGFDIVLDTTAPAAPATVAALDSVGPVTGAIAQGSATDDARPQFTGSGAEANAVVTLYDGATVLGTATVDASGNWSFTPLTPLADGAHAITATLTDQAGNVSAASPALNFAVDTGTVIVSIAKAIDDVGTIQGDVANNGLTDDATPTLAGTATPNAVVTVKEGTTVLGSVTTDSQGNWSLTLPPQSEGAHTYTAVAANTAGTEGSANFTLTIDLTPPSTPVVGTVSDDVGVYQGTLAQNGYTDDTTPTLAGSGATPGNTILVYDNGSLAGSVTVASDGTWNYTPTTPLAEGTHNLTAVAVDAAGNQSAPGTPFVLNVDTTPPQAAVTITGITPDTGTPGDFVTSSTTLTVYGTLSQALGANESVQISIDGGATWINATSVAGTSWSYVDPRVLADGEVDYAVRVIDTAGNVGSSASQAVFIDTGISLSVQITDITPDSGVVGDFITNAGQITVTGTLSQALPGGAKVQVSTDGGNTWADAATTGTSWIYADPTAYTGSTTVHYDVRVLSAGGDVVDTVGQDVVIDMTPPAALAQIVSITEDLGASGSDFITSDNRPVINGQVNQAVDDGSSVLVSIDGGNSWQPATTFDGTNWTLDLGGQTLADGSYVLQARVQDAAGNLGTISTQVLQINTQPLDAGGISSTFALNTDTSVGVAGVYSTAQTATNGDLTTRDQTLTFSGTLTKALTANQYLQLSLDDGHTWVTVLSQSGTLWTYSADALTGSQTLNVKMQVVSASGVVATGTSFVDQTVVLALDAPPSLAQAPNIASVTDTNAAYAFSSTLYGKVAAGSLVALVDDVNRDGTYEEGIDRITGYATADQNGDWSFNASLGKGLHNVGFVVWDAAGNASGFSPLVATSTGTLTNTVGSSTSSTGWGGTATGGSWGLGAGAATIDENGNWAFFQSSIGTKSGTAAYSGWVFDATPNGYSATYLPESSAVANAPTNGDDYGHVIRQGVFVDVNRDGYMDVFGKVSQDSAAMALWTKNADGSYTASSFTFPPPAWWNPLDHQNTFGAAGSVIAWDRYGDGYSDFVVTYSGAGLSWQSNQSYTYISNNNGVLSADAGQNGFRYFQTEVSGVDVNNNGTVDLAGRSDQDSGRALDIQLFNADGSIGADKMYNGVFRGDG
ncbi:Ig-like domain-containing protein, partial [Paraburkholderia caballeronis]|uniref:Ig-like domain-containing protein n=2 Tax=Paraburkholderia caballeronis TaxID=416943 RepID=UPI0010D51EF8